MRPELRVGRENGLGFGPRDAWARILDPEHDATCKAGHQDGINQKVTHNAISLASATRMARKTAPKVRLKAGWRGTWIGLVSRDPKTDEARGAELDRVVRQIDQHLGSKFCVCQMDRFSA